MDTNAYLDSVSNNALIRTNAGQINTVTGDNQYLIWPLLLFSNFLLLKGPFAKNNAFKTPIAILAKNALIENVFRLAEQMQIVAKDQNVLKENVSNLASHI